MHSMKWKKARRAAAQRREIVRRWRQAVILSNFFFREGSDNARAI